MEVANSGLDIKTLYIIGVVVLALVVMLVAFILISRRSSKIEQSLEDMQNNLQNSQKELLALTKELKKNGLKGMSSEIEDKLDALSQEILALSDAQTQNRLDIEALSDKRKIEESRARFNKNSTQNINDDYIVDDPEIAADIKAAENYRPDSIGGYSEYEELDSLDQRGRENTKSKLNKAPQYATHANLNQDAMYDYEEEEQDFTQNNKEHNTFNKVNKSTPNYPQSNNRRFVGARDPMNPLGMGDYGVESAQVMTRPHRSQMAQYEQVSNISEGDGEVSPKPSLQSATSPPNEYEHSLSEELEIKDDIVDTNTISANYYTQDAAKVKAELESKEVKIDNNDNNNSVSVVDMPINIDIPALIEDATLANVVKEENSEDIDESSLAADAAFAALSKDKNNNYESLNRQELKAAAISKDANVLSDDENEDFLDPNDELRFNALKSFTQVYNKARNQQLDEDDAIEYAAAHVAGVDLEDKSVQVEVEVDIDQHNKIPSDQDEEEDSAVTLEYNLGSKDSVIKVVDVDTEKNNKNNSTVVDMIYDEDYVRSKEQALDDDTLDQANDFILAQLSLSDIANKTGLSEDELKILYEVDDNNKVIAVSQAFKDVFNNDIDELNDYIKDNDLINKEQSNSNSIVASDANDKSKDKVKSKNKVKQKGKNKTQKIKANTKTHEVKQDNDKTKEVKKSNKLKEMRLRRMMESEDAIHTAAKFAVALRKNAQNTKSLKSVYKRPRNSADEAHLIKSMQKHDEKSISSDEMQVSLAMASMREKQKNKEKITLEQTKLTDNEQKLEQLSQDKHDNNANNESVSILPVESTAAAIDADVSPHGSMVGLSVEQAQDLMKGDDSQFDNNANNNYHPNAELNYEGGPITLNDIAAAEAEVARLEAEIRAKGPQAAAEAGIDYYPPDPSKVASETDKLIAAELTKALSNPPPMPAQAAYAYGGSVNRGGNNRAPMMPLTPRNNRNNMGGGQNSSFTSPFGASAMPANLMRRASIVTENGVVNSGINQVSNGLASMLSSSSQAVLNSAHHQASSSSAMGFGSVSAPASNLAQAASQAMTNMAVNNALSQMTNTVSNMTNRTAASPSLAMGSNIGQGALANTQSQAMSLYGNPGMRDVYAMNNNNQVQEDPNAILSQVVNGGLNSINQDNAYNHVENNGAKNGHYASMKARNAYGIGRR